MRISDEITAYILHMLEEEGYVELQRNLLAEEFGCVPSQINYVLTSRFKPEQGFIVESRRGGGGYIRIYRVRNLTQGSPLMHVVNAIGDTLSADTAKAILDNLVEHQCISRQVAQVMMAALTDNAYRGLPSKVRDSLRAAQFKLMLTALHM